MAFYSGQKVVCIDNKEVVGLLTLNAEYIVAGGEYTPPGLVGVYISLVGISDGFGGSGFYPSRFRPLVSRPTNISIFTAMLGPRLKETIDG